MENVYKVVRSGVNSFIILIWLVFGLYFGIGGYTAITLDNERKVLKESAGKGVPIIIDDTEFNSVDEYYWVRSMQKFKEYFGWLAGISDFLGNIITAMAFGIIGGVTRIIKQLAFEDDINIVNAKVISLPLLGMLSSMIMLGITFLLPTILISGEQDDLRPETIVFLTLFAGLFAQKFYEWLNNSFEKIFPNQSNYGNKTI